MKKLYFLLYSSFSVFGFSQTILNQSESTARTVQDPNVVVLAPGFHATSSVSNPFVAKIGAATETSSGGPNTPSTAGSTNPSGTTETTTNRFHDTQGNIEVNGGGQLQFTLPIALPPGVKSVAPQINLVYTSGGGNGIAGYGWNISGITAISRMGKTIEKDGEVKGIQLDYSDYYSFNGQRLILKDGNTSTYGQSGAEYVTEKFSNIKIKSIGTISGQSWQGPEYWEVTFEDGSQAWYGATQTGASNARTPIEYNIVKWKDAQGNFITYNYAQNENVAVISNIQWGGNEAIAGSNYFNEVNFNYKNRELNEISYLGGLSFLQKQILTNIIVKTNGLQFKKYEILYSTTDAKTPYEIPLKITELNSTNEASNPVIFDNTLKNTNIMKSPTYVNLTSTDQIYGDFDGDGKMDALYYTPGSGAYEVCLREDINGYCEEYQTFPAQPGGTFIIFNKLNGQGDSVIQHVSDENLSKGVVGNTIDENNKSSVKNSIIVRKDQSSGMNLKVYQLRNGTMVLIKESNIPKTAYDHTVDHTPPPGTYEPYSNTTTSFSVFKEVDVNGDGMSEIVFSTKDYVCNWDIYENENNGIGIEGRPPVNWDSRCFTYYNIFLYDPAKDETYGISSSSVKDYLAEDQLFDIDGNGLADLVENKNNRITYQSFKKQTDGRYSLMYGNSFLYTGETKGVVFGDFNADGKMDFVVPEKGARVSNWRLYVNNGKSFVEQYLPNFSDYRPETVDVSNGYREQIVINHFAKDVNGDGKDDIIRAESQTFKKHTTGSNRDSRLYMKVILAAGADGNGKQIFQTGFSEILNSTWEEHYIPVNISYKINNTNRFFIIKHGPEQIAYSYYNVAENLNINQISQGGILTDASFIDIDAGNSTTQNYYKANNNLVYPFGIIEHLPNKLLVTQLKQGLRKQDYQYRDLVFHLQGKGMIGFRQTARSSWYTDDLINTKIWSGAEIDPLKDGVPIKEWSTKPGSDDAFPANISEVSTQLLSYKSTQYRFDKLLNGILVDFNTVSPADKAKVISATVPIKSISKDFMKDVRVEGDVRVESDILYDAYYLPISTTSNTNNGFAISTTNLQYFPPNLLGVGKDYFVGRPQYKTEKMQVFQDYADTKESNEEYIYDNNLLQYLKTFNRDESGGFLEKYTYDGWGNVIAKETTKFTTNLPNGNGVYKKDFAEYDSKGRFVIKKTDNIGLETLITYNDWGQVETQTDPLGNILTNTYDNWGKILTAKTNLGGTTTYTYEKASNKDAIVTEYSSDGNKKISFTNHLGQNYKSTTKNFGQGQYVSATTVFDGLGRKIATSEPYSGQSPTQWNTTEYDEYSRPKKATSFTGKIVESTYNGRTATVTETNANNRFKKQTADPLGNIIISEDLGGIINFKFNAAGENIEANYEGNIVKTSYDAWGNKVRFEDPSNGVYEYEYNGYMGAISKTKSPKGEKTYEYNNLGQLTQQKEKTTTGNATDKVINFAYNSKGMITQKSGTSLGKSYSSGITYDNFGRVLSSYEDSNGKYFMKKGITYDEMMRVTSYEKSLYSSGILTKVALENVYDTWNGELSKVKEKGTGKILWELNEVNEKGQVVLAKLGNTNITNTYAASGFLNNVNHANTAGNTILQIGYSFNAIKNELNSRVTGGDFNIIEQFEYDDNNRLYNWTDPVTGAYTQNQKRNVYDKKGRITQNDQVGNITFGNTLKKYQPTGMVPNTAGLANYTNELLQKITYNENNDPFFIDGVKGDVAFEYGLTSMRQKVTYGGNFAEDAQGKFTKYYSEDGSYEIIKNNQTGQEKHLIYIGGSPYDANIVYLKDFATSTPKFVFLHKDYLGSILAITDEAGTKLEQRHFDAWGNLTHLKIRNQETLINKEDIRNYLSDGNLVVDRGYTSHEHFAEVGLIHMNGRLYDPLLRRFLNADENIQDQYNTQNYNKYGYVMNNPLMYNDPSGEFIPLIAAWFAANLFWSAVIIGATVGLAAYTLTAAIMGQKWNLGGALKATFFGAVGGAATFGIGSIFSGSGGCITTIAQGLKESLGQFGFMMIQAGTHAVAQGVLSVVQGGKFISAAVAGFAGSLGASAWGAAVGDKFAGSAAGTIAFGAISGGIGSELSGGNFWQGALIGGVVAGLNHEMHSMGDAGDNDDEFRRNADGTISATGGKKGGDTTDYLYDSKGKLIGSKGVTVLEAGDNMTADISTYGLRLHTEGTGVTLGFGELSLTAISGAIGGKILTLTNMQPGQYFFKGAGDFIAKNIPKLGSNRYLRVGISKSRGRQVFRITYGNNKNHWFDYDLGKIPKIK